MFRHRFSIALAAMATVMMLFAGDAQARAGGGFSSGSRGMRTFVMPPTTRTAPNSAAPIERSIAQPGAAPANQAAVRPGLFGGGLFGGMAAGFVGAGLFGLLFGHGFFGGIADFASLLGLLLQVVLVVFVGKLIFAWWQRRNMPQPAYAAAHPGPDFGGFGGAAGGGPPADEPLVIGAEDYDTFEQMLYDIQADFSAEDMEALRTEVTPELLSYFAEQLADNAKRGLVNRVTDVKLLQGDLAEAWREDDADYATVTIRFANTDSVVERASGRVVEGGTPDETTELWTFTRARDGDWMLSAIQQT
ncbi:MAG: TIM44-like domain-containing protein [Pseudolabrys sp.]